jgi:tRNA-dihydrouridine synthase B
MQIGPYKLDTNLILAPMAGVTDRPFRQICRSFGAGMAVSEMISANPALRKNRRTLLKADHNGEQEPRIVQIVGADPLQMADAARYNADQGAQVIDINMGCPAKKVCNAAAGSALLRDEKLVARILGMVVGAVHLPVTLKIRTGWDKGNRNAAKIARIAEDSGICALTIHGRTRACGFSGRAEFETIRNVKQKIRIPVIANGDIDTPKKAQLVLQITGADAIMIGRGAQGQPWIFQQIQRFISNNQLLESPSRERLRRIVTDHLEKLYGFYGDVHGVRIARKHIGWYLKKNLAVSAEAMSRINSAEQPLEQMALVDLVFDQTKNGLAA